jgi:AraC-like DNA-binding protein
MTIAREALRREAANLATIAETIGDESDTAFSLAFKRRFGSSPGRYRTRMQRINIPFPTCPLRPQMSALE